MDNYPEPATRQSRYSCLRCRRLKKKCDRRKPECSLCRRQDRSCLYKETKDRVLSEPSSQTTAVRIPFVTNTPSNYQGDSVFPAVYFTDSSLFRRSNSYLPDMNVSINIDLQSLIGDKSNLKNHTEAFFRYAYPWAPFISKTNFHENILNPLSGHRVENLLLMAAMILVMTVPDTDPRTTLYCNIKAALLEVELKGGLTFRILQTLILIAIYELGHAIYPSAYLTIGYCARYGIALGINETINSHHSTSINLVNSEEERRTWWAIILLDRYLNIGSPERTPLIEEPSNMSVLPMDDKLWELGHSPPSPPLVMSSPPSEAMGRFGLTVQAAYLLGKVLSYTSVQENEQGIQEDEARLLDNTLAALTKVTLIEGRYRAMGVCSPTTICHSARLVLSHRRICLINQPSSSGDINRIAEIQATIASEMLTLAKYIIQTGLCGNDDISPFCHDALYRSAIIYAQMSQRSDTTEAQDALHNIKKCLKVNSRRWRAAAAYLDLLEARDLTGIL